MNETHLPEEKNPALENKNPWQKKSLEETDPEFKMFKKMLCMLERKRVCKLEIKTTTEAIVITAKVFFSCLLDS